MDEPDTVVCGACDGTGEAGRFGGLRCRACHGTGEVMAEDDASLEARIERAEWLEDNR